MNNEPELIKGDFFTCNEQIPPGSVDLVLTDPPFGILQEIQVWDILPDLQNLEIALDYVLKPSGQVLLFCDIHLLKELMNTFKTRFQYRFFHIWKKPGGMPVSHLRPIKEAEFILLFRKKGTLEKDLTFNPEAMGESGEPYFKNNSSPDIPTRKQKKAPQNRNLSGTRYPKTIIEAPHKPNMKAEERSKHPTQKPELLLRKLIRGYSNPGELVFDPFSGSGSTLISAYKEGRRSIGFEIEEQYFTEAKQRIDDVTCQAELFA